MNKYISSGMKIFIRRGIISSNLGNKIVIVKIVEEETCLPDSLFPSIVYSTVLWVFTAWFVHSAPNLWVRLYCQAASVSRS